MRGKNQLKSNRDNKRLTKSLPKETTSKALRDEEMEDLELIIDAEKGETTDQEIQLDPENLDKIKCFKKNNFNSIKIRNTATEFLTPENLFYMLNSLKAGGSLEIRVKQELMAMHEYDIRVIKANALLAGFIDVKSGTENEGMGRKGKYTVKVPFVKAKKPLKQEKNIEIVEEEKPKPQPATSRRTIGSRGKRS